MFWRGATTGGEYNLNNYSNLPRLSLVMISKSFPHLVDAKFTHFSQFSNHPSGRNLYLILEKLFGNQQRVLEKDHLKYKYLISLDRNTTTWLRVPWILLSNSVLLKQETNLKQFFYPALEPFVHYIPIKKDISDIFEKLCWLQNNDDKAKTISENATSFIVNNLMPKDIDNYLLLILDEYHSLQRFEVEIPTMPFLASLSNN